MDEVGITLRLGLDQAIELHLSTTFDHISHARLYHDLGMISEQ